MFSRKSCYFFVRPKKNFLEVCVFLGRPLQSPQIRRVDRVSTTKVAHLFHVRHRDEVEPPVTDWLQEAYELSGVLATKAVTTRVKSKPARKSPKKVAKRKPQKKETKEKKAKGASRPRRSKPTA